MSSLTAIIETTESCNLGCKFCLRPSFSKKEMSNQTLEKIVKYLLSQEFDCIDFIWHGGEPLLVGSEFFRNIISAQSAYNTKGIVTRNYVQTNGLALTPEMIKVLEDNRFIIGTSVQGTKETHDKSRVTLSGGPTYDRLMKKVDLLKDKPSAICVLTTDILGNEREVYHSLKERFEAIRISEYFPGGIIPQRLKGDNIELGARIEANMPTALEFGKSMIAFYEIWKADSSPIDIRPITEIIRSFIIGRSSGCLYSQDACRFGVIGIKSDGEFYSCIRGAPNKEHSLGFVDENPLHDFDVNALTEKEDRQRILLNGDCKNCKFWKYCNGGCPLESEVIYGDRNHKTYYCEGRKMIFNAILRDLKRN